MDSGNLYLNEKIEYIALERRLHVEGMFTLYRHGIGGMLYHKRTLAWPVVMSTWLTELRNNMTGRTGIPF